MAARAPATAEEHDSGGPPHLHPDTPRDTFPAFPYEPYPIQVGFMRELYATLQHGGVAMLESPTGTGKTMSVICGALQWLADHNAAAARREEEEARRKSAEAAAARRAAGDGDDDDDEPDWLRDAPVQRPAPLPPPSAPVKKRSMPPGAAAASRKPSDRPAVPAAPAAAGGGGPTAAAAAAAATLDEFVLDDGAAAEGAGSKRGGGLSDSESGSGSDAEGRQVQLHMAADATATAAAGVPLKTQIIFCSRTHSQLAQFVGEVHRTPFAQQLSLVALGSRSALCVNDDVRAVGSGSRINEKCMDLQQAKVSSRKGARAAGGGGAFVDAVGVGSGSAAADAAAGSRRRRAGKKSAGCPFLRVSADDAEAFQHAALASPVDVEELARLGKAHGVCAYYGARRMLPAADVIIAPYSAVLHEDTRTSLGLRLEGSVVIFDEAHNLVDAVNGVYGAALSEGHLAAALQQLGGYQAKFVQRLAPGNAQQLQLLVRVLTALQRALMAVAAALPPPPSSSSSSFTAAATPGGGADPRPCSAGATASSSSAPTSSFSSASAVRITTINDFLFGLHLDNVNLFQLLRWAKASKLAFKVSGYAAVVTSQLEPAVVNVCAAGSRGAAGGGGSGGSSSSRHGGSRQHGGGRFAAAAGAESGGEADGECRDRLAAMHACMGFLAALTNADADGRVIVQPASGSGTAREPARLRYVLLNAAAHFSKIVAGARAVALVSGTLSPVAAVAQQLFPGLDPSRLRHYGCGHIVPPSQLTVLVAARGPSGHVLDLRQESRGQEATIDEVGRLLVNVAQAVPGGLVVFAPSFAYVEQLVGRWTATGLLAKLAARKSVFVEPRSAHEVEAVLQQYAACCLPAPAAAAGDGAAGVGVGVGSQPDSHQQQQHQHQQQLSAPPASAAVSTCGGGGGGGGLDGAASHQPANAAAAAPVPRPRGALLLCVVGAKLSEGINFGDDLGRCVVVLGMPYPNPTDPELVERMRYLDAKAAAAAASTSGCAAVDVAAAAAAAALPSSSAPAALVEVSNRPPAPAKSQAASASAKAPAASAAAAAAAAALSSSLCHCGGSGGAKPMITGQQYYQSLCTKAVNQCVGRVIRHKGDYAAIVLADVRYLPQSSNSSGSAAAGGAPDLSRGPVSKLPGWIQQSLAFGPGDFRHVYSQLHQFFRSQPQAACSTQS